MTRGAAILTILGLPTAATAASLSLDLGAGGGSSVAAIKMALILTGLTLAPAVLLTATSFVRIVIVFSFLKSALGLQNAPPQQVLVGLGLFLTAAVMSPVGIEAYDSGLGPYLEGSMAVEEALERTGRPLRDFMLRQTREDDLSLFAEINGGRIYSDPTEVGFRDLLPAFVISELRTSFEMGVVLFAPFLVIDLIVASILMAMGMVMLPPALVSLPLKVLFFVMVDGWGLLVTSLVGSFA